MEKHIQPNEPSTGTLHAQTSPSRGEVATRTGTSFITFREERQPETVWMRTQLVDETLWIFRIYIGDTHTKYEKGDLDMNNKREKGAQPLPSDEEASDGQGEGRTSARPSWLGSALGMNEDTRISQARSMSSELFLQTRLFPLLERRVPVDRQTLVDLLVEFKRSRKDLDVDFEIANVMARILNRLQWYLMEDETSPLGASSDTLDRDLELLTCLADLDFQRIDAEVSDRLQSK